MFNRTLKIGLCIAAFLLLGGCTVYDYSDSQPADNNGFQGGVTPPQSQPQPNNNGFQGGVTSQPVSPANNNNNGGFSGGTTPQPVVAPGPQPFVTPGPQPVVSPAPKPIVTPGPRPIVTPAPQPINNNGFSTGVTPQNLKKQSS